MEKRIKIKISGFVQGVCFRYYTRQRAEELNLKGLVRNEFDGTVYIEAQGNEASLKKLVEWCQNGPRDAKVENVKVEDCSGLKEYSDFRIIS